MLFPAAASSRQREITTIWNESMLEMVLDGLTTENASELSLAALLFRMKHEDHGGSDGSGSSWGNVVRAVSAMLLEALSRAEESPEVIVTLQYLRFEGLQSLPLSTLRHLHSFKVESTDSERKDRGSCCIEHGREGFDVFWRSC